MNIRKAELRDGEEITALLVRAQWFTYKELYSEPYIQQLIGKYYNEKRIRKEITEISDAWHGYYIALEKGNITGIIGGGLVEDKVGEIYVFYLDPELRGKGIGTRLLEFYTQLQKHHYSATEQRVSVAKGNHFGIPFYEARGFVLQEEQVAYGASKEDKDISLLYSRSI
ncbi:GNAT family N-acetyltransferase [Sporosarcina sp. Te-1]|uniref:GNAT family N-acetyltransferase n=1 Tax=Sporosarcina sp. Te-1 TaxID=2818390 RepID=UPI001A9CD356|nr:GNAT family N-acetyltransferase [Sporosarcina sp. Te-1]QTD41361.1 GNAT family N-acetyltransferase [Sporosarcina sp. Te-1]